MASAPINGLVDNHFINIFISYLSIIVYLLILIIIAHSITVNILCIASPQKRVCARFFLFMSAVLQALHLFKIYLNSTSTPLSNILLRTLTQNYNESVSTNLDIFITSIFMNFFNSSKLQLSNTWPYITAVRYFCCFFQLYDKAKGFRRPPIPSINLPSPVSLDPRKYSVKVNEDATGQSLAVTVTREDGRVL